MNLITDRTNSDSLFGTEKGQYGASDLNRVESAVRYLSFLAESIVLVEQLITKTDWGEPGPFSTETWPTKDQMNRYLHNVKSLCASVGISVRLPASMDKLTWQGANQIEAALLVVKDYLSKNIHQFFYSGEIFAGEDCGL